ncbi:MAG: hypothetical protein ACI4L9_01085 [Candidatus Coproplasma sp.]
MARYDSRTFIFAALGAAMGLGNAMRFPGLCYKYGGAFVIAYAVALAAAYPLLCAELSLGKRRRAPFPVAIKSLSPRAGAVGWAACINSAFIAVYYVAVIARLSESALFFGVSLNCQSPRNMPDLTYIFALLVALCCGFLLTRSAKSRANLARVSVTVQTALFILLAARGLIYENAFSSLGVLAVRAGDLLNAETWLNALGQALLSLSVAAGVMPSFAVNMPTDSSPERCALVVVAANFCGGLLSAVALITVAAGCNLSGDITSNGFSNAFALFPKALAVTFKDPVVSGIFGTVFLLSLTLTATVSALSLALPLFGALENILPSCRARALAFSAVFCISLAFVRYPQAVGVADFIACNAAAPAIAVAESCVFLRRILTERRGRDRIYVWKIWLKSRKN